MELSELLGEPEQADLEATEIGEDMSGYDKKEKGPKRVLVSFYLSDILDINIAKETFHPVIDFNFDWVDDGALKRDAENANYWCDGYVYKESSATRWSPMPLVKNDIRNGKPVLETQDIYILKGRPVMSLYWSLSPLLRSEMDLKNFPFDEQELKVHLSGNWLESDVKYIFNYDMANSEKMLQSCVDPKVHLNGEYIVKNITAVSYSHKYQNLTRYDNQDEGYSEIVVTVHVERRPAFYLRSIFSVMFIVQLISCLSYWLGTGEIRTRFSVSTGMLLTMVAFHFVALNTLPKINYSTRMDGWIALCYALLFCSNIENIVIYRLLVSQTEFCTNHCFTIDSAWFAVHLLFLLIGAIAFAWPYIYNLFVKKPQKFVDQKDHLP